MVKMWSIDDTHFDDRQSANDNICANDNNCANDIVKQCHCHSQIFTETFQVKVGWVSMILAAEHALRLQKRICTNS